MSTSAYGTTPPAEQELAFFDGQSSASSKSAYGSSNTSGGADNPFGSSNNMRPMATESSNGSLPANQGGVVDYFKKSSHPWASLFHILFKLFAALTYLFGAWFTTNYVLIFVVCVLLSAFESCHELFNSTWTNTT